MTSLDMVRTGTTDDEEKRDSMTGKAESLEKVYRDCSQRVFRTAYRLTSDRDMALDILQEVFLRYIGAAGSLANPEAVPAWLYRVTTNCAFDALRERSRSGILSDPESVAGGGAADEKVMAAETRTVVMREIEHLPWKQQLAVIMRFFLGDDLTTIARTLDLTYDSARVTLHRGLRRLRKKLGQKKGGLHVSL